MLQHLTSGECAESLAKHSEYSKDYGVKKIARLLKEWQTLGRNSANLKIGIQRLVDFGIFVYPSLTQAQVPADAPRAVAIQQEQKAASPGSSSDFKSPAANTESPKATSSEGAILNSQRATD